MLKYSKIYRTDIDGSIMFKIKKNNIKIETCSPYKNIIISEIIKNKEYNRISNDNTIGIIICKKENKFIIEYCSDRRIAVREYKFI